MDVRSRKVTRTIAPRLAALLLALTLVITLSSCSFFTTPPPPRSVENAATALKDALGKTTGISDVKVTVAPRDAEAGDLDKPGEWLITLFATVRPTAGDLYSIASAVENGLDVARRIAPAVGEVQLAGDRRPNAALDFDQRGPDVTVRNFVDTAQRLRTLTDIERLQIFLGEPQPSVTVRSPDQWLSTVTQLRSLQGFGAGLLTAVTVHGLGGTSNGEIGGSITVDALTPSNATLAGLREVAAQPGVTSLSYDAVRPSHSLDDWRPSLTVDTDSASARHAVVRLLTGFDRQSEPVSSIPRASFRVYETGDGADRKTDGYLGLPLGSAEPADLVPAPRTALDPAVEAARLQKNVHLVQTLLDAAGDTAGIRGTSSVSAIPCDNSPGTQVTGSVVIPIFQITDHADGAYAAIVATWKRQGYTTVDSAGPAELRTGGPLRVLAIQGTTDGIVITAESHCG